MNLREGTRRLALLLGVAGAIGGSFLSYLEFQEIASQRARHNRFEQLATLDAIRHLRTNHQNSSDPYEAYVKSVMPGCCGIKEVVWDTDHVWNDASGIYAIAMDDGETLSPTAAPAAWQYLFVAFAPVVGFLMPWGVVRAIGWMLAGFVAPST